MNDDNYQRLRNAVPKSKKEDFYRRYFELVKEEKRRRRWGWLRKIFLEGKRMADKYLWRLNEHQLQFRAWYYNFWEKLLSLIWMEK